MQTGRMIKMLAGMTLAIGVGALSARATLLAQWNMEDYSPWQTSDSSGNGNTLNYYGSTYTGSPGLSANAEQGSYSMSMPGGWDPNIGYDINNPAPSWAGGFFHADAVDSGHLIGANQNFTLSGWFNPAAGSQTWFQGLLHLDLGGGAVVFQVMEDPSVNYGRLYIFATGLGDQYGSSASLLMDGQWNHLTMQFANKTLSVALNGTTVFSASDPLTLASANSTVFVGGAYWTYGGDFNGLVDNVSLTTDVPEPSSLLLLGVGGLLLWRRRK